MSDTIKLECPHCGKTKDDAQRRMVRTAQDAAVKVIAENSELRKEATTAQQTITELRRALERLVQMRARQ